VFACWRDNCVRDGIYDRPAEVEGLQVVMSVSAVMLAIIIENELSLHYGTLSVCGVGSRGVATGGGGI